jgi:hypothetical protein
MLVGLVDRFHSHLGQERVEYPVAWLFWLASGIVAVGALVLC